MGEVADPDKTIVAMVPMASGDIIIATPRQLFRLSGGTLRVLKFEAVE
jgi:hypothetical protein